MLRHKLSAGVLRAASPSPITASASHATTRPRSRSLASAVLLSSQINWKRETVVVLKTELKKRGLSQQGNKASLIARLESAEASSALGPLPPLPSSLHGLTTRGISTTAPTTAPPKSTTKPKDDVTTAPSSTEPTNNPVDTPSVTSAGPAISSQRTEALKPQPIEPELVTVAPGLPESKLDTSETKMDVQLPKPKAEQEIEQVIPLVPDNFSSNAALPSSEPVADPSADTDAPKILTVAPASTHLSGGPVHGTHERVELEQAEETVKDVAAAVPGLVAALGNVLSAPANAMRSAGLTLPELNLPKAPKAKDAEYKANDRPLDAEEKRGAWILAGVVGLGLFLGGPKKEKKVKSGSAHGLDVGKMADSAKNAVGIKGDAQWEKASGAKVVGHGTRKD